LKSIPSVFEPRHTLRRLRQGNAERRENISDDKHASGFDQQQRSVPVIIVHNAERESEIAAALRADRIGAAIADVVAAAKAVDATRAVSLAV
jgi:hypothetical protein